MGKPDVESYVCYIFDLASLYEKYTANKFEGKDLYTFVSEQPDSVYIKRILKELNDKFNLLYVEQQVAQQQHPVAVIEEIKFEEDKFLDADQLMEEPEENEEDKEAREMVESSKVLSEIYGNKIKLSIKWFFEYPVVLKEKPFGSIENPPKDFIFHGDNVNYEYGDEYGDELGYFGNKPMVKKP